jgi:hypothetical protein
LSLTLLTIRSRHFPLVLLHKAKLIVTPCASFLSSTLCTELITQWKSRSKSKSHKTYTLFIQKQVMLQYP